MTLPARTALAMIVTTCLAAAAVAAEAQRSEPAHVHGKGSLNIAVEGNRVTLELETPAADILGFESKAKTSAQKAEVKSARKKLSAMPDLFKLPAAAGCRLEQSKIDIDADQTEKHDDHGHDKAKHEHDKADHTKHDDKDGEHSEVHAEYTLQCATPQALTSIDFAYFAAFPRSNSLTVNLVSAKAQTSFEVSRDKPVLSLAGSI